MKITEKITAYRQYVKKITDFKEAIALAEWDMRTGAPRKGIKQRSEVIGTLSDEVFKRATSVEMKAYIDALTEPQTQKLLDPVTIRMVEESKQSYERLAAIPAEAYKAYIVLKSEAQTVWKEAKEKNDFALLCPYLKKIVAYKQGFIDDWGITKNRYDALLDLYEPGLTAAVLDPLFATLHHGLSPLVEAVAAARNQPDQSFLSISLPIEKQKAFCLHLLREIGYDLEAGRLDETEHPFEITLNPGDVRITTHYRENHFIATVLGVIHEGGHALYEQHISRELVGTPLCAGTSMGIHESQSLFFEHIIGRSKAFWARHYDQLKRYGEGRFDAISLDDFYRAINAAKPSLIRTQADALTYPLHIMVRYDIEKALFNDDLDVEALPEIWNEKMREYLGVVPSSDRDGVLQDIHWPGGDFGYFPSYALGYIYAAQFKHALLKDIPDFDDRLRSGNLQAVTDWLEEHIHRFGKLKKPLDILKDATGEEPNPDYLLNDLSEKYRDIYQF